MVAHTGFLTHARLLVATSGVNLLDLAHRWRWPRSRRWLGYRLGLRRAGRCRGPASPSASRSRSLLVDDIARTRCRDRPPQTRLLAALAFVPRGCRPRARRIGLALGVGARAGGCPPARACIRRRPRSAARSSGVLGVLVAVWLLIPALASTPGWPAQRRARLGDRARDRRRRARPARRQARDARPARRRRTVPRGVRRASTARPTSGPPPDSGLDPAVARARVARVGR